MVTRDSYDWQDRSLCRDLPAIGYEADFFPENRRSAGAKLAKQFCGVCPVRVQCLDWALDNDERYGVWGGLDPKERAWLLDPSIETWKEADA